MKIRAIIAAALGVAALGVTMAVASPASAIPRSCVSGSTATQVHNKPEGSAAAWFVRGSSGRSHPVECMQTRVEIFWSDGGFSHKAYSGWIVAQYKSNGATLVTAVSTGGPGLSGARQERQWVGGSHRMCRDLETGGKWHTCAG